MMIGRNFMTNHRDFHEDRQRFSVSFYYGRNDDDDDDDEELIL